MADGGKPRHPLAKGSDETRIFDKMCGEVEPLDLISGFGVKTNGAVAEAVFDRRDGGGGVYCWEHSGHRAMGLPEGTAGRGYRKP
jgi:hypothetical protein